MPRPSPVRRGALAVLLLLAAALFAGLGAWQVERWAWKLDLIASVERRLHAEPLPAPGPAEWPTLSPREEAYTRLRISGTLLTRQETLVQAVTELGAGFWSLVPLRTEEGWTVLVNRGFVPADRVALCAASPAPDQGSVTGLLRASEPGGAFLQSNDPAGNRWFSRDVAAIAAARGLGPVAPYFLDAEATPPGALPVGGLTVVAFRNSHLVYALTWFGLCGLSLGGLWLLGTGRLETSA